MFKKILIASITTAAASLLLAAPHRVKVPFTEEFSTPAGDTNNLPYPIKDHQNITDPGHGSNLDLDDPSNIKKEVTYDPSTNKYILTETLGDRFYRNPTYMSFEEYLKYQFAQDEHDYWMQRSNANALIENKGAVPKLYVGNKNFDRIFGGSQVDIKPSGNVELTFGYGRQIVNNPTLPKIAKNTGGFDFDMNINLNVVGKIGDKMKLTTSFNTQATFDYENQIKLEYTGQEDEIIKKIAAGNVSLPLSSSLIQGNQSLFGIKTQLQFGRLTVTSVASQQKSKSEEINIQGGAQTQTYNITADQYEDNKHFFLGTFFRNNYNKWLKKLPLINSGVNVTRVEIWVTNKTGTAENVRDIVGFMDLGEYRPYQSQWKAASSDTFPQNSANKLYRQLTLDSLYTRNTTAVTNYITSGAYQGTTPLIFEKTYARKLTASEFTLYPQLGFISVNQTMNPSDILAVAYEYTYKGKTYRVGEFTQDVATVSGAATSTTQRQNVLFLKLLKGQTTNTALPMWKLMMKNIYSLGAYQVNNEDFKLDVTYSYPTGGEKRFINEGSVEGQPLIRLLNLDHLNSQNDPIPDGIFDFVPGVTIVPANGRIIFPVLEPFGSDLKAKFKSDPTDQYIAGKYVYQELYDKTKTEAAQVPEKNRFNIKGSYKSSNASDIYLGAFNLPQGSVKVSSGGQDLKEGMDYTVDYNLWRVKIINDGILNSGQPIKIRFENNAFAGLGQVKTFLGHRFDFFVNDNLTLGGTWLHLSERPFTQKVNIGDDPISNSIYGLDAHYNQTSGLISKIIDKLPFYSTKEKSTLTLTGEVAKLDPGHSKSIGKTGTVYIDDFEGSQSNYDLKFPANSWSLASTPRDATRGAGGPELFPESKSNKLDYNYNRAKLSWYSINPYFTRANGGFSSTLTSDDEQSNHFVREITEKEIFPDKQLDVGQALTLTTLDLAFHPTERGPYNYTIAGLDQELNLKYPSKAWGGIMRSIDNNDFEASNIEFIQFWVLDPFIYDPTNTGGELYFNLGNVSEDVLKDSRITFENGLPREGNDTTLLKKRTVWGYSPSNQQATTRSFDNDPAVRKIQDVGYDGASDAQEAFVQKAYVDALSLLPPPTTPEGQARLDRYKNTDPAADNFHFDRGTDYDNAKVPILKRYDRYNNPDGNSPTDEQSPEAYPTAATNIPESEDINKDNALNEKEDYFQYRVELKPSRMVIGQNFINDIREAEVKLKNGNTEKVKWYQFKIPINDYEKKVGDIVDFKSIRFMRMYLTNFNTDVNLRFAKLELVRNQWRRYAYSLGANGEQLGTDINDQTYFNVGSVNLEENSSKKPVGYVLPPGIVRSQRLSTQSNIQENEQALSVQVCNLKDGDAKAVYKTINLDLRQFKELKLFTHAEAVDPEVLHDHDLYAFIRLGSDFVGNYYEYAVPLMVTANGSTDPAAVWPLENEINIAFADITAVKKERNYQQKPAYTPFIKKFPNGSYITVVGNPDLGLVKTCMLGVRNPKVGTTGDTDDGMPKCAEVWFNELRMDGLDEKGGYAAMARADVTLADLAAITFSGNLHTIGYGSLEQKVADRYRDNFYQYTTSINSDLGKLLPKQIGLKLPVFAGISEQYSTPKYDPYQLDVELKPELAAAKAVSRQYADSLRKATQDFVQIKSLNVTNIRIQKEKKEGKKPLNLPTNIENFNVSYAYTETYKRNPTYESDDVKNHKAGLGYNYSIKQKFIKPFGWLPTKSKYFALIKDFNFNLLPTNMSFKADIDRRFGESNLRRLSSDELAVAPLFDKYLKMTRTYGLKFDPAKSISIDFNAVNNSRIDEPYGKIDTRAERDTIINRIVQLKRTIQYHHDVTATYTVPFSKFPLTDWISSRASYGAGYTWTTAPLTYESLGNVMGNTQTIQVNGDMNFNNLYNKVKFLKRYNTKTLRQQTEEKKKERERAKEEAKKTAGSKTPTMTLKDTTNPKDKSLNKKGGAKADEKKKEPPLNPELYTILKPLMGLKRINATYSDDRMTTLPGYFPRTRFLGMDSAFKSPGYDLIAGQQPSLGTLDKFAVLNRMSGDPEMNAQFVQNRTRSINVTSNIEPMTDFKFDLTFNANQSRNLSENYKRLDSLSGYGHYNKLVNGSYTTSFIALNTFFDKPDKDGVSPLFQTFEQARSAISKELGSTNPASGGASYHGNPDYAYGYGPYSQYVLIPAFLKTYANVNVANTVSSYLADPRNDNLFSIIPKPNWRISYTGLSKLPAVKSVLQTATISHTYNSTFTIGQYTSNLDWEHGYDNIFPTSFDSSFNFLPYYSIPGISISEQLSPLIGVDLTWKNNLTTKVDYKRSRQLAMSFIDYQLNETRSAEITIGGGWKKKGVNVPFKVRGKKVKLKNDLTVRVDGSYRKDKTISYKLDQNINVPTRGMTTISFAPYADYVVNQKLNVRLFFEYRRSIPAISTSYPITNFKGGVKVRFTLSG